MTTEGMLISAIVSLAGVISFLWMAFFHPLVKKMLHLIDTLTEEQPKQTAAIKEQTPILESIRATSEASKHATAEQLKMAKESKEELGTVHAALAKVCRVP
jgi:type II secretory pathway component PulM